MILVNSLLMVCVLVFVVSCETDAAPGDCATATTICVESVTPNNNLPTATPTVTVKGSGFIAAKTSSYNQTNLALHLDAINNTGTGHSNSATTWKDLTANNRNGTFSGSASTSWANKYLQFALNSTMNIPYRMPDATAYTVEVVFWNFVDATYNTQFSGVTSGTFFYTASGSMNGIIGSFWTDGSTKRARFEQHASSSTAWATSPTRDTNRTTFAITSPASGASINYRNGGNSTTNTSYAVTHSTNIIVNSIGSANIGTTAQIAAIRVYNRVLSASELTANYNLDNQRYFSQPTPTVNFGGNACTSVTVIDDFTLTCTAPASTLTTPLKEGSVDVGVTNSLGTATLTNGYTYVSPRVISVAPNTGPAIGGRSITITGAGFTVGMPTAVTVGGAACTSVRVISSTTITCITGPHAVGQADVVVSDPARGGDLSLANSFTYFQPTITAVTPNHGPVTGGTNVTITGTNFASGSSIPVPNTMQEMTQEYCASMAVYNGTNPGAILTLEDQRGNRTTQQYQVAKLADNNCWMLNNLKLGSTDSETYLTPSDTNISSAWYLPQVVEDSAAPAQSTNLPIAYGPVPGGSDDYESDTFYGYLYNWCAATAEDPSTCTPDSITPSDATVDICPAGWRLPRGGNVGDVGNEFDILSAKMAGFADNQNGTYQSNYSGYYQGWQFDGPFKGVLSGAVNGSFGTQGQLGYFWSGSYLQGSGYNASALGFDSSFVEPGAFWGLRDYGGAIRCVTEGGATTVTFDGVPATNVTVVNDTTITATAPAHAEGLVDVTVSGLTGTATSSAIWSDTGTNTSTDQTPPNIQSGFLYQLLYIELTSSGSVNIGATPSGASAVLGTGSHTITAKTNNLLGYILSLAMAPVGTAPGTGQPICSATGRSLVHTSAADVISASNNPWVADGIANTALATNTWGYSLADPMTNNGYFMGVPACDSPQTIKQTSTANESGDNTTVYYGAKIDITKTSGTYTGTVMYKSVVGV